FFVCFCYSHPATAVSSALSLHDALPIYDPEEITNDEPDTASFAQELMSSLPNDFKPLKIGSIKINSADIVRDTKAEDRTVDSVKDRKSTRLNSSHVKISYAVFCLKKKKI